MKGFEPSVSRSTGECIRPTMLHLQNLKMAGQKGVEPLSFSLTGRRNTVIPPTNKSKRLSRGLRYSFPYPSALMASYDSWTTRNLIFCNSTVLNRTLISVVSCFISVPDPHQKLSTWLLHHRSMLHSPYTRELDLGSQ